MRSNAVTINSVVLILPAALAQRGNEVAVILGHDEPPGATFATPLSPTGDGDQTHVISHSTARHGFLAQLAAMKAGQVPDNLAGYADVFAALYMRVEMDVPNGDDNIEAALKDMGLSLISEKSLTGKI